MRRRPTVHPLVFVALFLPWSVHGQGKVAGRMIDLPGFSAVGVAPPATVDLPGFNAAGVVGRVPADFPGFAATGVAARRAIDLTGFTAAGVLSPITELSGFTAMGASTAPKGQATVAKPVPAPPRPVADSVSSMATGCAGGCFDASGSVELQPFSLHGPAVVNANDGSRFQIVLGKMENGATYLSFAREPGGPPRAGKYAVADLCSEQVKHTGTAPFSAEFVVRAYEAEVASFLSTGGSIVIESVASDRFAGRFDLVACRYDSEGKRHEVRVSGTFNAVK